MTPGSAPSRKTQACYTCVLLICHLLVSTLASNSEMLVWGNLLQGPFLFFFPSFSVSQVLRCAVICSILWFGFMPKRLCRGPAGILGSFLPVLPRCFLPGLGGGTPVIWCHAMECVLTDTNEVLLLALQSCQGQH